MSARRGQHCAYEIHDDDDDIYEDDDLHCDNYHDDGTHNYQTIPARRHNERALGDIFWGIICLWKLIHNREMEWKYIQHNVITWKPKLLLMNHGHISNIVVTQH